MVPRQNQRAAKRWLKDSAGLIRFSDQDGKKPGQYASRSGKDGVKRLVRGIYVESSVWESAKAQERLALAALAQAPSGSSTVIAGLAAAAVHGLPLVVFPNQNQRGAGLGEGFGASTGKGYGIDLITNSRPRAGYHGIPVRRVGTSIQKADVALVHDRRVTDIPKTVVDICRSEDPRTAIAVADAALRGWTTKSELLAVLNAYRRSPGNVRAREPIAAATELSESVGESLTKLAVVKSGLAAGEKLLQQVIFRDGYGVIGRVDFYIPALGLVIEFDGDVKYTNGNVQRTEQVMGRELKREKRLKNLGLEVVRLTWRDVVDGRCVGMLRELGQELRTAIARGKRIYGGDYVVQSATYRVSQAAAILSNERRARWMLDGRL